MILWILKLELTQTNINFYQGINLILWILKQFAVNVGIKRALYKFDPMDFETIMMLCVENMADAYKFNPMDFET